MKMSGNERKFSTGKLSLCVAIFFSNINVSPKPCVAIKIKLRTTDDQAIPM